MHDLSNAEPVYKDGVLIGYVLEIAENLYLPLDTSGANITGPSHKKDAEDILSSFYTKNTPNITTGS